MGRLNNYAFIDGVNLHLTYENLAWKVDYQKLRNLLAKRFDVVVAFYFLGNVKENGDIHTELDRDGYTVRLKTPTLFTTQEQQCPYCKKLIAPALSRHKADCDSMMTLQVISDSSDYDKAVLVTSDGDFDNLVTWLLNRNKLRLVLAPCKDGCSGLLLSSARGRIAFIDEYKEELEKLKK
jgi:uncharacterized LabA/DUF88 family protein